ncbi:putative Adenosine kinase [Euzebya pacifica]|uniref:Putative Adenosine kinase n=1 Tax=Euzebya pacifica TaxID=1608957 RepID=A0A346Y4F6_9ACTN|nr:carbohydrate kinase family protein [Euzebya pacifica]AXV09353.1 putative Adenosine kinase [Euzebya pacifica]
MRIAVTGSIAEDLLLTFPGKFADMILADQLERLSLSFLADGMQRRRGGVGGNIAYGMGQLGANPILVGAVGDDFLAEYKPWLERNGVDCDSVYVSPDKGMARFLCTTDAAQSQIATFYSGAMEDCKEIDLGPIAEVHGGLDLVVVSPNGPEGMLRHTRDAHAMGIDVVADPSQQLARMHGPEIRPLIEGAKYLICNDYERSLITKKTGWSDEELRAQVEVLVTTHGAKGASIEQPGQDELTVLAVAPQDDVELEPTGAGDAFRAGFLSGLAAGLPLESSAQLGCATATLALETVGPQEYVASPAALRPRLATAYGDESAEAIIDALDF